MNLNNKEEVRKAIENGMPCYKRYGFAWKGARARLITKEEALRLLPNYNPGIGFYELCLENNSQVGGKESIVFNEYSANDMW